MESATTATKSAAARAEPKWVALARRVPFTIAVVAAMLILGVATGTLWDPLGGRDLLDQVAYGLPAFRDGRWWTLATGSLFAFTPAQYLPVAGGFAILVGWSEVRLGTRRVALVTLAGQAIGVLGSALVLLPLSTTAWIWADRVAGDLDVGFSAGALAAVSAATVTVSPPWRARLRLILVLYAVITFLYIGLLWDLEHLLAVAFGLAIGPTLVGRRIGFRTPRLTRREWRIVAATLRVRLS